MQFHCSRAPSCDRLFSRSGASDIARAVARLRNVPGWLLLLSHLVAFDATADSSGVEADRRRALVVVVRQDCGACHGMRLTGGLGPPLTSDALKGKPKEMLRSVILQGRTDTAMPPWRSLLSYEEADWIASQLLSGFPEL